MKDFLKDLCTPQEILALEERWLVCQYLHEGKLSHREIKALTGTSLTTIGRVARSLQQEPYQGYIKLFRKIEGEKDNG
jgi:uncharacterized protein YerC